MSSTRRLLTATATLAATFFLLVGPASAFLLVGPASAFLLVGPASAGVNPQVPPIPGIEVPDAPVPTPVAAACGWVVVGYLSNCDGLDPDQLFVNTAWPTGCTVNNDLPHGRGQPLRPALQRIAALQHHPHKIFGSSHEDGSGGAIRRLLECGNPFLVRRRGIHRGVGVVQLQRAYVRGEDCGVVARWACYSECRSSGDRASRA
jgi:hypothetical protein